MARLLIIAEYTNFVTASTRAKDLAIRFQEYISISRSPTGWIILASQKIKDAIEEDAVNDIITSLRYSKEEEYYILNGYLSGLSVTYLALKNHRNANSIKDILRQYGVYILDKNDSESEDFTRQLHYAICQKNEYSDKDEDEIKWYESLPMYNDNYDNFYVNSNISEIKCNSFPDNYPLHYLIQKVIKICDAFNLEVDVFYEIKNLCLDYFDKTNDLRSKLAFLRHLGLDLEYFDILCRIDLGASHLSRDSRGICFLSYAKAKKVPSFSAAIPAIF